MVNYSKTNTTKYIMKMDYTSWAYCKWLIQERGMHWNSVKTYHEKNHSVPEDQCKLHGTYIRW